MLEVIIKGNPKEISTLVLALQERRVDTPHETEQMIHEIAGDLNQVFACMSIVDNRTKRIWMESARKNTGLTMKESAVRLGISESYYSMIERGERQQSLDMAFADKISRLFGVSLKYIAEQERSGLSRKDGET